MNEHTNSILNILQGQQDPLSSRELSSISGLTQTEVLKAVGDLALCYNIEKRPSGYILQGAQTPAAAKAEKDVEKFRQLLTFLASSNKAWLPKTLREALDWDADHTKALLHYGKKQGVVSMKNNGVYYLTLSGVMYIQQHYPDVEVKAFVMDKVKEHNSQFQIVPQHVRDAKAQQTHATTLAKTQPHPAITQARSISNTLKLAEQPAPKLPVLTNVPVKIQVLDELAICFGNDVQIQLQELSGFLREYARG